MKDQYGEVTSKVIAELRIIVGNENVSTKENEIEEFSHDEMPLAKPSAPQVIVKPTDTQSIANLLSFVYMWSHLFLVIFSSSVYTAITTCYRTWLQLFVS